MLYVGTAGFSYLDWRDVFYPAGMKRDEFLSCYSARFAAVELDFTYYRQPSATTMLSMAERVPDEFRFTVKAHRTMTHEIPPEPQQAAEFETFLRGVEPMVEAGKLGCILFQFPWSYRLTPENLEYVVSIKDRIPCAKTVIEFRNNQWAQESVYKALRKSLQGFCCVDEPNLRGLFPRVSLVTSDVGYLRFHGRNAAKWFNHREAWERYDYLYSDDELKWWIPRIQDMVSQSDDTYVFFNNCHRGQAAVNAVRMKELLEYPGDDARPSQK